MPLPSSSSSCKRRNRWRDKDDFNERQTTTQNASLEDELRMIAQTSVQEIQLKLDIPQPLAESVVTETITNISKSKWDDNETDITTDSRQQNPIQLES